MNLFVKSMPFVFVILWSTGFIGAKFGLPYIEAYSFLVIRFLLVLLLLTALVLIFRVKLRNNKKHIIEALITGGLLHGAYLLGVFSAIQYGLSAGMTALIVSLQPILTALIVRRLFSERLAGAQWLGIFIALIGVAMVLSAKITAVELQDGLSYYGLGFATLALFSITIGAIYQKHHKGDMDLRVVGIWQYVGGLLVVTPFALFYDSFEIEWSGELMLAMAWLVIVLSIITIFLLLLLIKAQSSNQVASLFFMVPSVTAIFGWLLFGETLGWFEIAAIVIASYGVLLARAPNKPIL